jgi:carotenoid cleavage dioxygenase-like enzyme
MVDINPGYVFHTVNAHDDGPRIVLHVIRHPHLGRYGAVRALPAWPGQQAAGLVQVDPAAGR